MVELAVAVPEAVVIPPSVTVLLKVLAPEKEFVRDKYGLLASVTTGSHDVDAEL
jgi:hypothetical protein